MTTAASDPQIVPRPPAGKLALRAADQGVASAPGVRPRRQHPAAPTAPSGASSKAGATRWVFQSLPAQPLTVARYLGVAGQERHQRLGDLIDQPGGGQVPQRRTPGPGGAMGFHRNHLLDDDGRGISCGRSYRLKTGGFLNHQ